MCCACLVSIFSPLSEDAVFGKNYCNSITCSQKLDKSGLLSVSGMIVTSALIIWKALMCITGSESPVVVVLSGSMEPGFKRVC